MLHRWWIGWGPGDWGSVPFGPLLILILFGLIVWFIIAMTRSKHNRSDRK